METAIARYHANAITTAEEIEGSLSDYPVLNEEDFSRREYEAQIESIGSECRNYIKDGVKDGWEQRVFSWFWSNEQRCLDDGSFWAAPKVIRRCLRALKLTEPKYIYVGSALIKSTRPGCHTRDVFIRLRRENPNYAF